MYLLNPKYIFLSQLEILFTFISMLINEKNIAFRHRRSTAVERAPVSSARNISWIYISWRS